MPRKGYYKSCMMKFNGNRFYETDNVFVPFSGGPEVLHTPCVEETCSVGTASRRLI
jgi:hypothetical protein